ncbi:MAB_1171c family putative transporter [Streptomyces sp. NPDC048665]|uniref:MAB_1171c family putative transporter n=1 Tax=Streptomyces sp. NPDC048665 TaxID=3155490 RepID=UPI0034268FED
MTDIGLYLISAVFVLSACYLRRVRWKGLSAATRYGSLAAAALGAKLSLLDPLTIESAARLRLVLLPVLLGAGLYVCAACAFRLLALALYAAEPPRCAVRRELVLAAGALLTSLALELLARPRLVSGDLVTNPSHRWYLVGYDAIITLYLGYCLAALVRPLARRARLAGPGLLRTAMRLFTLGALAGLAWDAWGVDDMIREAMTSTQDSGDDTLSAVLGGLCIGLLAAGVGSTLWAPISTAVRGWFGACRRYRALTPLWGELHAVLPEITLIAPRGQFGPSQVHFALYRRVIEIQDARMILRHYTDPRTVDWLAEATRRFPPAAEQVSLIAEAASLAGALERAAVGALPTPRDADASGTDALHQPLEAEADWLAQLGDVFATSPVIAHVRATARKHTGPTVGG